MKKLLLTVGIISTLALTGCDTFVNKEEPEVIPEASEPTAQVTTEGSQPIEPEVTEDVVTENTTEETTPENPIVKVDTVEVTAKQLGRDYEIDGYRSDKLYEDKALTVTGEVDNIFISSSSDKAIVFLKTENEQIPVMASGEAAFATRVKDLKIKDTVELLCQGTKAVSKAPQVNECTVL